ncbi:9351_t:CDS:2 [Paraglomus brasilianum]|uniref:9351_t:CDS:1 n=1 Tax=Paraglomus brasilianum TaxID=144538 RepID=A0A9N9GMR4_9GLOM|nr:9351_t:CDS:2 [Paraglomus brasilianum]
MDCTTCRVVRPGRIPVITDASPEYTSCHVIGGYVFTKRRNYQAVWDGALMEEKNICVDCHKYMNSDKALLAVLKQLWSYGLAFLYNGPSLNTSLRPAVIPIQPATTPPSGRPRCGRKRKAESPEERERPKRQQLADLEEQNTALKEENTALRERHAAELTAHREENERLAKRSQNVLPSPEIIIHPLDGLNHSCMGTPSPCSGPEPNSDDLLDYIDLDYWASDMLSMLGQDQKDGIC